MIADVRAHRRRLLHMQRNLAACRVAVREPAAAACELIRLRDEFDTFSRILIQFGVTFTADSVRCARPPATNREARILQRSLKEWAVRWFMAHAAADALRAPTVASRPWRDQVVVAAGAMLDAFEVAVPNVFAAMSVPGSGSEPRRARALAALAGYASVALAWAETGETDPIHRSRDAYARSFIARVLRLLHEDRPEQERTPARFAAPASEQPDPTDVAAIVLERFRVQEWLAIAARAKLSPQETAVIADFLTHDGARVVDTARRLGKAEGTVKALRSTAYVKLRRFFGGAA